MISGVVTYTLTITMVKISILTLYRRIFSTSAFRKKIVIVGCHCWDCMSDLVLHCFFNGSLPMPPLQGCLQPRVPVYQPLCQSPRFLLGYHGRISRLRRRRIVLAATHGMEFAASHETEASPFRRFLARRSVGLPFLKSHFPD